MKKFIDQISVRDYALAYTIAEALEKDEQYSVEFYDDRSGDPCRHEKYNYIDLKIFREEKLTSPTMGFSREVSTDDSN